MTYYEPPITDHSALDGITTEELEAELRARKTREVDRIRAQRNERCATHTGIHHYR